MTGEALIEITDAAKGLVNITFDAQFTAKGTIDAAAGTLTIANKQLVGQDSDGDLYFYLKAINGEGLVPGASSAASTVATISDDRTITFPAADIWALGDPAHEDLGWYFLTCANVLSVPVPENWESLSNGKIVENILSPLFTGAEAKTSVSIEVMRNADKPGVYKVVEPLVGIYTAQKWTGCPDMILDATDPDNVLVEMTSAGFSANDKGQIAYLSYSEYLLLKEGSAAGTPAEFRITLKRENGTTTITMPFHSILYLYSQDSEGKVYYGAPYVSTITFSEDDNQGAGVEDVTVSEAEGAVEYYNLQGVRLERPAAGVVIRVQGGKATKMLVK